MPLEPAELDQIKAYLLTNPQARADMARLSKPQPGQEAGYNADEIFESIVRNALEREDGLSNEEWDPQLESIKSNLFNPMYAAQRTTADALEPVVKHQKYMMTRFISQYLDELSARHNQINAALKKQGRFPDPALLAEQTILKNKIQLLKEYQKDFRDPKKNSLIRQFIENGKFDTDYQLLVFLHQAIFSAQEIGKKASQPNQNEYANTSAILDAIARHFYIDSSLHVSQNEKVTPQVHHYASNKVKLADSRIDAKSGIAVRFSKMMGIKKDHTPKESAAVQQKTKSVVTQGVQKDLDKIKAIAIAQLKAQSKKDKNLKLDNLDNININSEEFLQYFEASDAAAKHDSSSMKILQIRFIVDKMTDDINMVPQEKGTFKAMIINNIAMQFLRESAPKTNVGLLKKIENYVQSLTKQPQVPPNATQLASHLFLVLSAPESPAAQLVSELRSLRAQIKTQLPGEQGKTLLNIVDESLKIHDPHFDQIKRLESFIQDTNKELEKKPVSMQEAENIQAGKATDKLKKLAIAQQVHDGLVGKPGAEKLTTAQLEGLIGTNKQATKGFSLGGDSLGNILSSVLKTQNELEGKPAKKPKMG